MSQWKPDKIKRITNKEVTEKFYDPELTKYDVAVQEGVLTDTQRQLYFRQLVELRQLGAPVTGEMLADAAPIQGKSEYTQQISQMEKQQAEAAKQQSEVQQQLLQTQSQLSQAKAISDVALAKERYTRSIANMGLSDERNAEAVDNRASAALDRARAMKELAALDDDRLLKYFNIVRMMEGLNKKDEKESKSEDILVASEAEKTNAAFPKDSQLEEVTMASNSPGSVPQ